jgi:DNA-binding response OmpR family regulator
MPHILIADSDFTSSQRIVTLLEQARYHVSHVNNGRSALRMIDKNTPDLVLLEALLPDEEGFEICRRIRRSSDVPIVFHSTKARAEDRVMGLRLGADDYLSKSCAPAELIARIGAVLRRVERTRQLPTTILSHGDWQLDPIQQICMIEGREPIELTPREAHVLAFLMRRPGRVCTTAQIVRHVWGFANQQARSIVATSVWRLRTKLETAPEVPAHILTVRNVGYKFEM